MMAGTTSDPSGEFEELVSAAGRHYTAGNMPEAEQVYRKILVLRPDIAEAYVNLGKVLEDQNKLDDAMVEYRRALAIKPNLAEAHTYLGNALRSNGQFAEASARYERALALRPDFAQAHYCRITMQKIVPGDPKLLALEALAARSESLPNDDVICLHFALAKALEDVGEYDRSFEHLLKGNTLKRREVEFDEAREDELLHRIATVFDQNLFDRFAGAGDPSQSPIFIVGMPRSGTTLIEQVLASHPLVHGAGELWTLGRVAQSVVNAAGQTLPFPGYLVSMRPEVLARLGELYLAGLPPVPPGKTRMTDKAPGNYAYAGLIRLILPNAKIIHAMRDPVDTCLSCFSWYFTFGQLYSYDLAELGRQYRRYRELMQHWRTVLPATTLLDVRYEDMVDNLEEQARRLLDFCGLPWDDRCLNFHQTDRPVSTASSVQVRQPLYRSSLQRWRRYEKHLGPLLAELEKNDPPQIVGRPARSPALAAATNAADPIAYLADLAESERRAGRLAEAEQAYRQLLEMRPDIGEAYNNLGNVLKDQGRLDDALAQFRQAALLRPKLFQAHVNLGNIAKEQGRLDDAVASYQQALAAGGHEAEIYNNLGAVYIQQRRLEDAGKQLKTALTLAPRYPDAHVNLGILLKELGRYDQAMQCFQNALMLNPNEAAAHAGLANVLAALGRPEEALAKYDQALALKPDYAEAHYNRAAIKTFRPGDPEFVALKALAAEPARLPAWKMAPVHFALGKALDDVGQYDRAFEQWTQGNMLKRRQLAFDEAAEERLLGRVIETFDAKLFQRSAGAGDPSPRPIFILGLPCSGKTTVESILAGHPAVQAGGELTRLADVATTVHDSRKQSVPYPEYVSSLDPVSRQRLGQAYLAGLPAPPAGKTRVTDRAASNFWYAGLVHLLLPQAKIIHVTRDPIDTALACFARLFAFGRPFCYDLAELGRHDRRYRRLMDLWRSVLPPGVILEVAFEDVVENIQSQAQRLLEHCGLAWDDRCLNVQPTGAAGKTGERQPLDPGAVGRWRHYQQHLGPLLAELGPAK